MKLSKSQLALAKVINDNGGWIDESSYAANDADGIICGYSSKPIRSKTTSYSWSGSNRSTWIRGVKTPQWHQCVLSREEYYQVYPKADADGWIRWSGGECPVCIDDVVDVMQLDGHTYTARAVNFHWLLKSGSVSVAAYRLHKPDVKPEPCESVMRSIPEPESIDGLCAKVTEENKHQHVDAKPTIEQLAQGYRNAKDYADRLQKEAGEAAVKAEEFAVEIRKKILELQELIG